MEGKTRKRAEETKQTSTPEQLEGDVMPSGENRGEEKGWARNEL